MAIIADQLIIENLTESFTFDVDWSTQYLNLILHQNDYAFFASITCFTISDGSSGETITSFDSLDDGGEETLCIGDTHWLSVIEEFPYTIQYKDADCKVYDCNGTEVYLNSTGGNVLLNHSSISINPPANSSRTQDTIITIEVCNLYGDEEDKTTKQIYIGNQNINKICIGDKNINKIYIGDKLLFDTGSDNNE